HRVPPFTTLSTVDCPAGGHPFPAPDTSRSQYPPITAGTPPGRRNQPGARIGPPPCPRDGTPRRLITSTQTGHPSRNARPNPVSTTPPRDWGHRTPSSRHDQSLGTCRCAEPPVVVHLLCESDAPR